jgi:hypothetical protein
LNVPRRTFSRANTWNHENLTQPPLSSSVQCCFSCLLAHVFRPCIVLHVLFILQKDSVMFFNVISIICFAAAARRIINLNLPTVEHAINHWHRFRYWGQSVTMGGISRLAPKSPLWRCLYRMRKNLVLCKNLKCVSGDHFSSLFKTLSPARTWQTSAVIFQNLTNS